MFISEVISNVKSKHPSEARHSHRVTPVGPSGSAKDSAPSAYQHTACTASHELYWIIMALHGVFSTFAFSALTPLVGQQKGNPACKKTEWWGVGVVICLERSADLHMAQLMPLPLTVSCFSKMQIGFTFLVLAHPGRPGQRAAKRVCVCVHGAHIVRGAESM